MNESIPLGRSPMHRSLIPARIAFVCLGPASASGPSVFDWRVGKLETFSRALPNKAAENWRPSVATAQQSGGKLETFGQRLGGVREPSPTIPNNPSRRLIAREGLLHPRTED